MPPRPSISGPFIRGLDASTGTLSQPKGSIPRLSNMLLTKRGALHTCDGTGIVNAFNGVPTAGRGRSMCEFLFAPTGVARYYLRVMKNLTRHLQQPQNLAAADGGAGGSLPINTTLYYVVTALDGAGGETLISNEVNFVEGGAAHKVNLTWNVVPNAFAYNIYRGTAPGAEQIMTGPNVPVAQPALGSTQVTYTDDNTSSAPSSYVLTGIEQYLGSTSVALFTMSLPHAAQLASGDTGTVSGAAPAGWNVAFKVLAVLDQNHFTATIQTGTCPSTASVAGNFGTIVPPVSDTTQQTVLYKMPPQAGGVTYTDSDIVALYPADLPILDGGAGGGSGGGGGTGGGTGGGGGSGPQGSTPSGGFPSNVSQIPQMVQFTNRTVIALGNGYPPHLYSDSTGTAVNPAISVAISTLVADASSVVTITTAVNHGIVAGQAGGSIIIAGAVNALFNGVFVILSVPGLNTIKVVNLNTISINTTGGTLTTTSLPIISNFTPAIPSWIKTTNYALNSVVQPTVPNGYYFICIQAGLSNTIEPTWPTTVGQRVTDNSVVWQNAGLVNSTAPPPPGAAHVMVYAGALWVWDTSPTNTATGLDGPCSLRMSDVNNPSSWNPINQAFLDKDDGTEGMGLAVFTISAQGIPPQGSLIAFKLFSTFQIVGVFGSLNFAIQRVVTDMGCSAPRTIQFIPGFGIGRMAHLGVAVFDGVNDRIISEQVRPYLFPTTDAELSDITVADANWLPLSWAVQTANPPMYCVFIPIGNSNGALTRALCFDLVLKAWSVVDLPFPVSTAYQARPVTSNPITLIGSYSDGTLQRWQAGDETWATSAAGSGTTANVTWSFRTPTTAAKQPDERLYCRRVAVVGHICAPAPPSITVTPYVGQVAQTAVAKPVPASGDFAIEVPVLMTDRMFYSLVSGTGTVTIDGVDHQVQPKPLGVMAGFIA